VGTTIASEVVTAAPVKSWPLAIVPV
jgi:hypothetical protein